MNILKEHSKNLLINRIILLTSIFVLCFSLSGCVAFERFIIINENDKPIFIEYKLKEMDEISHPSSRSIEVISSKELDAWFGEENWKPISNDRINSDNSNKFILRLNPKEAVTIEEEDIFYIKNDKEKALDIKELKITDEGKEIYFKTDKKLFEEFVKQDFKIRYKS